MSDLANLRDLGAFFREAADLDEKHKQAIHKLGEKLTPLVFREDDRVEDAANHHRVSTLAEKSNF